MSRAGADTAKGRSEAGFTLVELLVAVTIGLIVICAAVAVFTAAVQSQSRTTSESAAVQQARTTMERMVRELRQGSGVASGTTPSAAALAFVTYVHGTCAGALSATTSQCRVTYSCASGACTRRVSNPDGSGGGAAVQVVSGLSDMNVFSFSPSATAPSYVQVTLTFPDSGGGNAITLTDGAGFRNKVG
jgi:prepilin-type N-terminal cleavage/methylation domain-containing protein